MKIKKGNVYSFDLENRSGLKQSRNIYNVQVLGVYKRRLFNTIYKVRCMETSEIFNCSKYLLYPYPTNYSELNDRVFVRLPDDMPTIIDEDIETINSLLQTVSKNTDLYTYCFKLKQKLEYYYNVRNV